MARIRRWRNSNGWLCFSISSDGGRTPCKAIIVPIHGRQFELVFEDGLGQPCDGGALEIWATEEGAAKAARETLGFWSA